MSNELIIMESPQKEVVTLMLNRPEKRNALNIPLLKSFIGYLEKIKNDTSLRVLILRGSGTSFCAGLDLQEASRTDKEEESANLLANAFQLIYQLPQVTLSAVQGAALAGGAGLACACDFLVMEENAFMGFPEVRRGLVAAQVMIFLKKQLCEKQIKELTILGEYLSAQKAYELGLAMHLAKPGQLMEACKEIISQVLKGSPQAIAATKKLINALSIRTLEQEYDIAMEFHHEARHSKDAQEGISAFLEKRKPRWEYL
jgi:methylglutaconyl-CoA hydratase